MNLHYCSTNHANEILWVSQGHTHSGRQTSKYNFPKAAGREAFSVIHLKEDLHLE